MGSGNVTTRGHDAPVVSADDHWNIAQLRPVAFLYGGVESVAVEMGDGEAMKLLVPRDMRRPTGRAGFDIRRWLGVAVTAQSFHGTIIGLNACRAKRSMHGRAGSRLVMALRFYASMLCRQKMTHEMPGKTGGGFQHKCTPFVQNAESLLGSHCFILDTHYFHICCGLWRLVMSGTTL